MSVVSVAETIRARKAAGSGALIGYLPVGYPDYQTSVDAAVAMAENGVDIIELGMPYSDPVMDGAAIQAATVEALAKGFRVADAFRAIADIRARVDVPVVFMAYWNLVYQYGAERFADDLVAAGGSGLITPDLIPDEGAEWIAAATRTGLDRVFLAAPSSTDERLKLVVDSSQGFVYTVSTMGITGARTEMDSAARDLTARLRIAGVEFACVGLGISTPEQVRDVLGYADGAIVGSALVAALREGGPDAVGRKAAQLAEGKQL